MFLKAQDARAHDAPAPGPRAHAALAAAVPEEDPCAFSLPADLRYVTDQSPGFTRRRRGKNFHYFDADGDRIQDETVLARIRALAIPPAYESVWICADAAGHLQACGRDARGRKQYRYHPRWRETRDATKYDRMLAFGAVLPRIRARVRRDMGLPGMPRDKVLATIVRLLDSTLIRVGNADYARDNRSYGLTTLRDRHVQLHAGEIRFQFRGKSGVAHDVSVHDAKVARIVKRCMDLPGHELFQYLDADGVRHGVDSAAINDYLAQASGGAFTAKDYRTWGGSVLALAALQRCEWHSVTQARKQLVQTIKEVAIKLGNTPAVCRRCYIHPAIVAAYEQGVLDESAVRQVVKGEPPRGTSSLKRAEKELASFLTQLQAATAA